MLLICTKVHAQQSSSFYLHQLQILLDQDRFSDAAKYADSLMQTVLKSGKPDSIELAYSWKYEVHLAGKDYSKALEYYQRRENLRDSITQYNNATALNHLGNTIRRLRESNRVDSIHMVSEVNKIGTKRISPAS